MATPRIPADWTRHAIFWHVYPLGFTGAERTARSGAGQAVVHRLSHLESYLDYAVELGCSALQLGPIFASESHGYDTVDHLRIDPRLGDEADFDRLVARAQSKGLELVLDGVFNHVGRSFPRLQATVREGQGSQYARWFKRTGPGPDDFTTFEGHHSLVALNHAEPEVAAYVTEVMQHWLGRGAAGFRLDAAYAVPNEFWQRVLPQLRERHPKAWFVGEVIHGDYNRIVSESGLDAVTQYELWKAIWSAINDQNFFELAHALERHRGFVEHFSPMTFVGNHDVTRIASRLKDAAHLPHALVTLFTVPGVPSIYAGDEQAFRGVKEERAGGDDAVRPAFPASPKELAPYGWPIYRLHQDLIALRRRHAFLHGARLEIDVRTNPGLVYSCHDPSGAHKPLTVALNVGAEPLRLASRVRRLLSSASNRAADHHEPSVVEPHGWLIGERES
jgi:glycosidase